MPLQAFNTDANGTMFHNMFSPRIAGNTRCYTNNQIQTVIQTIQNNVMPANNRYFSDGSVINFIPESPNETLSLPAALNNRRLIHPAGSGNKSIINGISGTTVLFASGQSSTDATSTISTFGVFTNKAWAMIAFGNNGSVLSSTATSHGVVVLGVAQDPLYISDLANNRLSNHFGFASTGAGTTINGARLQNMAGGTLVTVRGTASSGNYTFQCSADSGDGTTVSGLWATHLAFIDSTSAPNDFCIGSMPPIVLLGRGAFTLGSLYQFNNVGEGVNNANAYNRIYVAGPTYGTGGDRLLVQVYYES